MYTQYIYLFMLLLNTLHIYHVISN